jgi:hypothetical protein
MPKMGKKNARIQRPILISSSLERLFLGISPTKQPQFTQTTASSSNCLPHFEQYFIKSPYQ